MGEKRENARRHNCIFTGRDQQQHPGLVLAWYGLSYYINGDVCLLTGRRVESQDLELEDDIEYPPHAFRQIYVKFCVKNSILVLLQAVSCDILTYRMWTLE